MSELIGGDVIVTSLVFSRHCTLLLLTSGSEFKVH